MTSSPWPFLPSRTNSEGPEPPLTGQGDTHMSASNLTWLEPRTDPATGEVHLEAYDGVHHTWWGACDLEEAQEWTRNRA